MGNFRGSSKGAQVLGTELALKLVAYHLTISEELLTEQNFNTTESIKFCNSYILKNK